jgi:hypothetical protein
MIRLPFRNSSLESYVIRKRSCVVWRGAIGKVPLRVTRWSPTLQHVRFCKGGWGSDTSLDPTDCHADPPRFTALPVLITIAYSIASIQGKRIRKKQVQHYVGRVKEPKRTQHRHSQFWIGLYGSLWIGSLNVWSTLAHQLMALKPQKRAFFQRGLNAISLIQSAL